MRRTSRGGGLRNIRRRDERLRMLGGLGVALVCLGCWSPPALDRPGRTLAHVGPVKCIAFSPDGKLLAAGTNGSANSKKYWSGTVRIWDATNYQVLHTISLSQRVPSLAFSPDGQLMAVACGVFNHTQDPSYLGFEAKEGEVKIYEVGSFKEKAAFKTKLGCFAVAFSPDNRLLAVGCGGEDTIPGQVEIWDISKVEQVRVWKDFQGGVTAVAFSPDSKVLAANDRGDNLRTGIRFWNIAAHQETFPISERIHVMHAFEFTADGKNLASVGQEAKLWDLEAGRDITPDEFKGAAGIRPSLAYSRKASIMVTAGGAIDEYQRTIGFSNLWDLKTRRLLRTIKQEGNILCVAFSPDARVLATGSVDSHREEGHVRLWLVPGR